MTFSCTTSDTTEEFVFNEAEANARGIFVMDEEIDGTGANDGQLESLGREHIRGRR